MEIIGSLFVKMIGTLAVLMVLAGLIGGRNSLRKLAEGETTRRHVLLTGLMGGALGIYGNLAGIDLNGAVISIRDLGPMLAGVLGGPAGGLIAGVIAGLHRLTMGGITAYACITATCLIGLICGVLSLKFKDRIMKPQWAFLIGMVMECMHLCIVLLMVKPFETALAIVEQVVLPFVLINAVGFMILILLIVSMENQKKIESERSRIRSELEAASVIQHSLLPPLSEQYPGREEIEIAASMEAAKDVGGDFYDVFFVDKDTLAFVIADVSGKGIPAAMFMVNSKLTIQNTVRDIPDLAEAVMTANDSLCVNNELEMFVTAWIGLLDLNSGRIRYVNAGHNPPVIISEGGADFIRGKHGLVLAGMEGVRYTEQTAQLSPGDKLYLYTDGVTEAENERHELFGEDRLIACLRESYATGPDGVLEATVKSVALHVAGFDQFDDMTMMCIKYKKQEERSFTQ